MIGSQVFCLVGPIHCLLPRIILSQKAPSVSPSYCATTLNLPNFVNRSNLKINFHMCSYLRHSIDTRYESSWNRNENWILARLFKRKSPFFRSLATFLPSIATTHSIVAYRVYTSKECQNPSSFHTAFFIFPFFFCNFWSFLPFIL